MERLILLTALAVALVIAAVIRNTGVRHALGPLVTVLVAAATFALAIRPLGLIIATLTACIAMNIPGLHGRIGESVVAVILGVMVVVGVAMLSDLPVALWPSLGGM